MKMEEESKKNEVAEAESSGPLPEQVKIFAGTIGMTKNSARAIYLLIVLIHTENTGAAFSLFADSTAPWKTGLLIAFSVIALIVVSALLWKNHQAQVATGVGLSLIMGGALGNLWDRLARGRVVDFLLVYVKQYQWPVFNLADSAIVIGAGLLILEILLHKSGGQGESQPN
jgi:signal peptidase II